MSLVEMSLAGGMIILAAMIVRALGRDRLPVGAFECLWTLAWLRLTLPVRLPFRLSVWSLLERSAPAMEVLPAATAAPVQTMPVLPQVNITQFSEGTAPASPGPSPWPILWAAGALLLALALAVNYVRCRKRYASALPVTEGPAAQFWDAWPLGRRVSVRRCQAVSAPLTYGIARPVILLPAGMDLADERTVMYVLAHERAHIRRFDAARKLALAAALCLHWFNPLVWAMAALAGRDMERACDRAVVDLFGPGVRGNYARTLLDMEERRAGLAPLVSGFSKFAIEERIHSIMKIRPRSFLSAALALALVLSVGAVFATAAPEPEDASEPGGFAGEVIASSDGTVYVFTPEGEPVGMTQQEYKLLFDPVDVEWWTAEEYAAWLEQEKKDLQDCLGQRAWTSANGWFTWTQEKIDETVEMYEQILEMIKSGLQVSKTVGGRSDAVLMQGSQDVQLSSGDTVVLQGSQSPSGLHMGYSYTFLDGDDRTTLGPYDSPEALQEALKEEMGARVADGRLSAAEAQELLADFAPALGTEQIVSSSGTTTYSFRGSEGVELTEEERKALDLLLENERLREALEVKVDQQLYSVQTVFTDELQSALDELDDAIEPYLPFGLQYSYDVPTGELTMTWNGRVVRGLYDGTAGIWITGHSGDDWPDGAVELIAVYTDGELTGLRLATEDEQAQWDWLRAASGISGVPDFAASPAEPEADGTVTVPPDESVTVFFSQAEGPYGELDSGGNIRAGQVTAARGSTVSVGLQSRTDAALTVSLRSGGDSMDKSVRLKAGHALTVTFSPEKDGTYEIVLTNDGEYPVELIVSWIVSQT